MGMVTKIGIKPTLTEHTGSSIHEKANKKSGNVYIYTFSPTGYSSNGVVAVYLFTIKYH